MTMIPIKLVGGTHPGRYRKTSIENTINLMVTDNTLVDFAGYESKLILQPSGEARQLFVSAQYDHLMVVIDNTVYAVSNNLSKSEVGTLDTFSGDVFMAENLRGQIALVDGLNLYVYDYRQHEFSTIQLPFNPIYITAQNGRLLAAAGDSDAWYYSDFDATKWDADSLLRLEKADNIVATVCLGELLLVLGEQQGEVWLPNTSNSAGLFLYLKDQTVTIPYGCANANTIAAGFGRVVWLGRNAQAGLSLVMSTGGSVKRLEADGIHYHINRLNHPDTATAFLFQDVHTFYVISWPKDHVTLAFDFDEGLFYTLTDETLSHFIAKRLASFHGSYYFISDKDAKLYELGSDYTTYDGETIPRIRICPPVRLKSGDPFIIDTLDVQLEQGQSESSAKVELSLSKNGGISFGNGLSKTLNPLGQRINRLRFRKLGRAFEVVPQIRFYSKARVVATNALMEVHQ